MIGPVNNIIGRYRCILNARYMREIGVLWVIYLRLHGNDDEGCEFTVFF